MMKDNFQKELEHLINVHSVDNEMNVPDFILAEYIVDHLISVKEMLKERDGWFGFNPQALGPSK